MSMNLGLKYCKDDTEKGDVGIEIEMELLQGVEWTTSIMEFWEIEGDNSLKINGCEFVIKDPLKFDEVGVTLKGLSEDLTSCKAVINPSIRAGVHIHLNMQQRTQKQLAMLLAIYYPLETILVNYCGFSRESNLFCLRMRDAPIISHSLCKVITGNLAHDFNNDNHRYSALNLKSLFSFGTIEFRALNTPSDVTKIAEWVEIIKSLRDYSETLTTAKDLVEHEHAVKSMGVKSYLKKVFGEKLASKLNMHCLKEEFELDSFESSLFVNKVKKYVG